MNGVCDSHHSIVVKTRCHNFVRLRSMAPTNINRFGLCQHIAYIACCLDEKSLSGVSGVCDGHKEVKTRFKTSCCNPARLRLILSPGTSRVVHYLL